MPVGDGTGPMGMGPMTGRAPGYANPISGRGFGLGRGGGWGRRNWYYATGLPGWARFGYAPAWGAPPAVTYGPYAAPPTLEREAEFLRTQAEWLKEQLDAISKRIEEIDKVATPGGGKHQGG